MGMRRSLKNRSAARVGCEFLIPKIWTLTIWLDCDRPFYVAPSSRSKTEWEPGRPVAGMAVAATTSIVSDARETHSKWLDIPFVQQVKTGWGSPAQPY